MKNRFAAAAAAASGFSGTSFNQQRELSNSSRSSGESSSAQVSSRDITDRVVRNTPIAATKAVPLEQKQIDIRKSLRKINNLRFLGLIKQKEEKLQVTAAAEQLTAQTAEAAEAFKRAFKVNEKGLTFKTNEYYLKINAAIVNNQHNRQASPPERSKYTLHEDEFIAFNGNALNNQNMNLEHIFQTLSTMQQQQQQIPNQSQQQNQKKRNAIRRRSCYCDVSGKQSQKGIRMDLLFPSSFIKNRILTLKKKPDTSRKPNEKEIITSSTTNNNNNNNIINSNSGNATTSNQQRKLKVAVSSTSFEAEWTPAPLQSRMISSNIPSPAIRPINSSNTPSQQQQLPQPFQSHHNLPQISQSQSTTNNIQQNQQQLFQSSLLRSQFSQQGNALPSPKNAPPMGSFSQVIERIANPAASMTPRHQPITAGTTPLPQTQQHQILQLLPQRNSTKQNDMLTSPMQEIPESSNSSSAITMKSSKLHALLAANASSTVSATVTPQQQHYHSTIEASPNPIKSNSLIQSSTPNSSYNPNNNSIKQSRYPNVGSNAYQVQFTPMKRGSQDHLIGKNISSNPSPFRQLTQQQQQQQQQILHQFSSSKKAHNMQFSGNLTDSTIPTNNHNYNNKLMNSSNSRSSDYLLLDKREELIAKFRTASRLAANQEKERKQTSLYKDYYHALQHYDSNLSSHYDTDLNGASAGGANTNSSIEYDHEGMTNFGNRNGHALIMLGNYDYYNKHRRHLNERMQQQNVQIVTKSIIDSNHLRKNGTINHFLNSWQNKSHTNLSSLQEALIEAEYANLSQQELSFLQQQQLNLTNSNSDAEFGQISSQSLKVKQPLFMILQQTDSQKRLATSPPNSNEKNNNNFLRSRNIINDYHYPSTMPQLNLVGNRGTNGASKTQAVTSPDLQQKLQSYSSSSLMTMKKMVSSQKKKNNNNNSLQGQGVEFNNSQNSNSSNSQKYGFKKSGNGLISNSDPFAKFATYLQFNSHSGVQRNAHGKQLQTLSMSSTTKVRTETTDMSIMTKQSLQQQQQQQQQLQSILTPQKSSLTELFPTMIPSASDSSKSISHTSLKNSGGKKRQTYNLNSSTKEIISSKGKLKSNHSTKKLTNTKQQGEISSVAVPIVDPASNFQITSKDREDNSNNNNSNPMINSTHQIQVNEEGILS